MALSAKFVADFSAFNDAVQKSQAQLKGFEAGAGAVERSLNRMADSFSGRQIIQQATLAAKAVEDIGGASTLTEAEQAKLNDTVSRAIDKFNALGQTVPPQLQAIADETQQATSNWKGFVENFDPKTAISDPIGTAVSGMEALAGTFGPIGALVGVLTAVGAAVYKLTSDAAQVGGTLNDMSQKTGIAVPMLSRLSQAAQVAGSDIEMLSNVIYKMDVQAADNPAKFAEGLERLGLNMRDFLALSPDERLLAFANALNETADSSQRNAAGAEVMGRQFKEVGPTLMKLNEAMRETAGISVWDEQQAADAERFQMQTKALKLALGDIAIVMGRDLIPAARILLQGLKDLKAVMADAFERSAPGQAIHLLGQAFVYAAAGASLLRGNFDKLPAVIGDTGHVLTGAERSMTAFWKAGTTANTLTPALADLEQAWREETSSNTEAVQAVEKANAAAKHASDELKRQQQAVATVREEVHRLEFGYNGLSDAMEKIGQSKTDIDFAKEWAKNYDASIKVEQGVYGIGSALDNLGTKVKPAMTDLAKSISSVFTHSFDQLPDLFIAAFTGGGGFTGAIQALGTDLTKGLFGGEDATAGPLAGWTKSLSKMVTSVTSGLGETVSSILGKTVSAFLPGLGALIGPLISGIKHLFGGPSADELAARDTFSKQFSSVQDAIDKVGTAYAKMGKSGTEAQQDLQRALAATHVSAQAEADALAIINGKIQLGTDATNALNAAIGRYKFSTEELGPALAKQQLDKQAQQLYSDWQLLSNAGINLTAIGREMGTSINDFLHNAVKTGTEVDSAMRPMLEQMAKMGLLTDAAGNTITNLDDAGVKFSISMSDGFKMVVDSVQKLTDAIKQALGIQNDLATSVQKTGQAAQNIPANPYRDWQLPETASGAPSYGATGGFVTPAGIQHFASGGVVLPFPVRGQDTVPAMLSPGEVVLTAAQQRTLSDTALVGGGDVNHTTIINLDGRELYRSVERIQTRRLQNRRKLPAA